MAAGDIIPVLFVPGQTEAVDPVALDPTRTGRLKTAQNVRWRKDGRAAKKYGNQAVGFASLAGYPNALFEHSGRRYVVANNQVLYKYGSTLAATGSNGAGETSRFLPDRFDAVRATEGDQPQNPTVSGASSKVGYWWDEVGIIYRRVYNTDGSLVSYGSFASGFMPRSVAVASLVFTVYRDGTTLNAIGQDFSIDLPSIGTPASIGTLNSSSAVFDACTSDGTTYCTAHYSALNTITIQRVTGTTTTSSAASSVTVASVGAPNAISVYATDTPWVYVAWVESGGALKVAIWNSTLGTVSGPVTVQTSADNISQQPMMIRASATSVTLIWGQTYGSSNGRMCWTSVSNVGAVGSINVARHVRPASRPFQGDASISKIDIWLHTADDSASVSGWENQRNYVLATIWTNNNTIAYQLSGQPLRASGADIDSRYNPQIVKLDGSWYTCLFNVLRSRTSTSSVEMLGLTGVSVRAHNQSLKDAFRQHARLGDSTYLAGNLTDVHGAFAFETGFVHFPAVGNTPVVSAGGSMSVGSYSYRFVYEYIDDVGRRHRSSPSEVYTATTTAGNLTVTFELDTLAFAHLNTAVATPGPFAAVRIHAYRTKVNQPSPYYRVTANKNAPDATGSADFVSFIDDRPDSALSEILYTDGGVLPNIQPPACRYVWTVNNRLVLGGLFVANKVVVSKLYVPGEPAQFSNSDAFAIFAPEDVTGVAGLDDAIVIFSENHIYVVYGDGPNDQGVGAYAQPKRVPGDIGCIDHRSIVETPMGLMFQSKRGLYLLPRGFGTPVFIGRDVQEILTAYPAVQSAVQVTMASTREGYLPENSVRFLCGDETDQDPNDSKVLTFDLVTGSWTSDNMGGDFAIGGVWDDAYTFTRVGLTSPSPIRQESQDVFKNTGSFAPCLLRTGDIRPFGLTGWGRFRKIVVIGESAETDCDVSVSWTINNNGTDVTDSRTFTITESAGSVFYREVELPAQDGSSISISLSDFSTTLEGLGAVFHGILVEVQKEPGAVRLPAGLRA